MTHSVLVSVGLVLTLIHLCHGLSSCESASVEDADSIIVESSKYVKIHTDDDEECLVMMNMLIIGGGGDTDTFLGHGGGSGFVTFEQVSTRLSSFINRKMIVIRCQYQLQQHCW